MLADNNFPRDVFEEVAWQSWNKRGRALQTALAQLAALCAPARAACTGLAALRPCTTTVTCTGHSVHLSFGWV